MIRVRQNEEYVLDNAGEIGLEEAVANIRICACKIVDDLQAHYKESESVIFYQAGWSLTIETSVRNISHRMLDRPNDAVHEQFKLWWREVK